MPGEKRKKVIIFLLIVSIFFLFLVSTRKEPPIIVAKTFELKSVDASYYEFVDEDTNCKDICYTEYVVLSNGMAFAKKEIKLDGEKKAEVSLGLMDKDKAGDLIRQARDLMGGSSSTGINCTDCRLYHLFYGDKSETRAFTSRVENAPRFMFRVQEMTIPAFADIRLLDPFFVHFIFGTQGGNAVDYHFYPEGTVLREEFGRNNGELIASKIYTLNPDGLEILKDLVTDDYFRSEDSDLKDCGREGLEWGYLEIQKGADYKTVYTCGSGASGADKIFNELLNKLNESQKE